MRAIKYEFQDIKKKIKYSINKLMEHDSFLLKENVNERSITHKLAEYLQDEFKDWNVDCEYNRMVNGVSNEPKRMIFPVEDIKSNDTEAKTVFPDIIIHKRNRRKNLLVIERVGSDFFGVNGGGGCVRFGLIFFCCGLFVFLCMCFLLLFFFAVLF